MGVNQVIYGGRTILDITDSTVTPDKVLAGAIGYGADGERFTGTFVVPDQFAKARVVEVVLRASGWMRSEEWLYRDLTDSDGSSIYDSYGTVVEGAIFDEDVAASNAAKYTQRVAASVSANDCPFVQCILSPDYEIADNEIHQFNFVTSLETFDGYIIATFENSELDDSPDIDLTLSLLIIDGVGEASMAGLQCASGRSIVATLPASKWEYDGYVYAQTITANIFENAAFVADGLFSIELETALTEMRELTRITDIVVSNGSVTAICRAVDSNGPPTIDLQITLKVFEIKE